MRDTLIIVHAYGRGQDQFDRHQRLWAAHRLPIMVYAPQNDPVKTHFPQMLYGQSCKYGVEANRRIAFLLGLMSALEYRRFVFFEQDSFCLDPTIPWLNHHFTGNVFRGEDAGFKCKFYVHPPIVISKATADALSLASYDLSPEEEHGFSDRWLGLLCEQAKLCPESWIPFGLGFSRNTIESAEDVATARAAIKKGAVMIHGVKSASVLNQLIPS